MKITTRQFGDVEIDEDKIVNMPSGIPGFKDKKRYVVLQKKEMVPFLLLQSVDDANLSFVILDPLKIFPDYTIEEKTITHCTNWKTDDELSCFVIVSIPNGQPEKMTANFMAPILINNVRKEGLQLILENSGYSHKHALLS